MDWKIELVMVPVADIDRAKEFYVGAGFAVDHDTRVGEDWRIVQLTPPGSGCSIGLTRTGGANQPSNPPGSLQGIQLVVDDVAAARAQLVAAGVDVTPVRHVDRETGEWVEGPGGPWNSFVFFDDPDGNGWVVQERPAAD